MSQQFEIDFVEICVAFGFTIDVELSLAVSFTLDVSFTAPIRMNGVEDIFAGFHNDEVDSWSAMRKVMSVQHSK